mmetsp:Transcript_17791/g.26484  ORF Transcript_17791/g.26484 Transcript_17791/m.26484 type:complete len:204 (+) Transcript_17791:396-1007(+)
MQLNDIACGHCKTGTVYHASDATVHTNVVEIMFGSFNFSWIFFSWVSHGKNFFLTMRCIVIKVELCINGIHIRIKGLHPRVNLQLCAIRFDKHLVDVVKLFTSGLPISKSILVAERFSVLERKTLVDVDWILGNDIWGALSDTFDINTTIRREHNDRTVIGAIHQNGQIILDVKVERLGHHQFGDWYTLSRCLLRNQVVAQHF